VNRPSPPTTHTGAWSIHGNVSARGSTPRAGARYVGLVARPIPRQPVRRRISSVCRDRPRVGRFKQPPNARFRGRARGRDLHRPGSGTKWGRWRSMRVLRPGPPLHESHCGVPRLPVTPGNEAAERYTCAERLRPQVDQGDCDYTSTPDTRSRIWRDSPTSMRTLVNRHRPPNQVSRAGQSRSPHTTGRNDDTTTNDHTPLRPRFPQHSCAAQTPISTQNIPAVPGRFDFMDLCSQTSETAQLRTDTKIPETSSPAGNARQLRRSTT
jgi:hypothetical protein